MRTLACPDLLNLWHAYNGRTAPAEHSLFRLSTSLTVRCFIKHHGNWFAIEAVACAAMTCDPFSWIWRGVGVKQSFLAQALSSSKCCALRQCAKWCCGRAQVRQGASLC